MRVAVVGSGVAGASTAFALAQSGVDVTVIDGDRSGQATAAGAGIVQPWSSSATGPFYDLYAAGAAYYPRAIELLGAAGAGDVGYRRSGSIVVDSDPAQLDEIERRLLARTADVHVAGRIERLDAARARELFPPLAPELQAVHIPGGARVDGRLLRTGLLTAAQRHGAQIVRAEARFELDGVAPGLADATVLETRVGLRPLAEMPIVGALREHAHVYLNVGFGAAGLTMGPLVGHLVAQLIRGVQPDVDVVAFAPADR